MSIDQPLWRAAGNVADVLLADDYASIEENEIEPLARAIWEFLVGHDIVDSGASLDADDSGAVENG
ncbi:hypothetical protein [Actinoplanes couchii]|nr:hypothetical protein [Actinoplanes couchii]MDR6320073.1 hypothetical protein [Actinoplanes couchii]